jgi:LPXTG-motif cell wall-anchored protein
LFKIALSSLTVADSTALPGDSLQPGRLTGLGLALSPDQSVAYVSYSINHPANGNGGGAYVVPVHTSSLSVGAPVSISTDITSPDQLDLAFTPDGKTVYGYLDDRNGARPVFTIDTTTNTLSSSKDTTPPGNFDHIANMSSVVVPADLAPAAAFKATVACAGTATAFDASSSTVANGTIVRYAWAFGDGTKEVTTGPKVKHTYAKPGSYAASVTETDSAGTSTTVVFDGQTVLRNGGPSARARHSLTITACAVPADATIPSSGSMAASSVDATLPRTGGNTGEALVAAGLLIGAGALLTRAGRRARA